MDEIASPGEDDHMPSPATVWAVELRKGGDLKDRKGALSLEDDALLFVASQDLAPMRIALRDITKVARVHGSPILMITHRAEGDTRRTAFYFAQPPPLEAPPAPPPTTVIERPGLLGGGARRPSRRRIRRQNVNYLGTWNAALIDDVREWVSDVRAAISAGGAN